MIGKRRIVCLMFILMRSVLSTPDDKAEIDGETSRKVIGSSVVTSVSVIMDTGNGTKAVYTDAAGKPLPKPAYASDLGSPIELLNPDRYEFYTFDDNGDLVKRLMTWDEIQGIIASGDGDGFSSEALTANGYLPEKKVDDVVNNVQNVLKEEIESHKESMAEHSGLFDTPDVSDTWSMILPAIFGNSGETIKPEKPIMHGTPDTIMLEPTTQPLKNNSQDIKNNSLPESLIEDLITQMSATESFVQIATSNPDTVFSKKTSVSDTFNQPSTNQPNIVTFTQSSNVQVTTSKTPQVSSLSPNVFTPSTHGISYIKPISESTTKMETASVKPEQPFNAKITTSKITSNKPVTPTLGPIISRPTVYIFSSTQSSSKKPKPISSSTVRSISSTANLVSFTTPTPSSSTLMVRPYTSKIPSSSASPIMPIQSTQTTLPSKLPAITNTLKNIPSTSNPASASTIQNLLNLNTSPVTVKINSNTESSQTVSLGTKPSPTQNTKETNAAVELTTLTPPIGSTLRSTSQTTKSSPFEVAPQLQDDLATDETFWPGEDKTSTYSPLVTFFSISDSKDNTDSRTEPIIETTTINDYGKTTVNSTETANSPYFTTTMRTSNGVELTTEPASDNSEVFKDTSEATKQTSDKPLTKPSESVLSTTELFTDETTNLLTKISATEILEQLLLSPDNIHVINSELSEKPPGVAEQEDEKTETVTVNNPDARTEKVTENISTAESIKTYSTNNILNIPDTEETKSPTTTSEPTTANNFDVYNTTSNWYTTSSPNAETTESGTTETKYQTIDSDLYTTETGYTTTELEMNDTTTADYATTTSKIASSEETDIISDSVGSILSQVFGYNHLTTIDNASATQKMTVSEKSTTSSDRKAEDTTTTLPDFETTSKYFSTTMKSTSVTNLDSTQESTTENILTSSVQIQIGDETTEYQNEITGSTVTPQDSVTTSIPLLNNKFNLTDLDDTEHSSTQHIIVLANETESSSEPHIINITILSHDRHKNASKPAKSDTSLEVDYDMPPILLKPHINNERKEDTTTSIQDEPPSIISGTHNIENKFTNVTPIASSDQNYTTERITQQSTTLANIQTSDATSYNSVTAPRLHTTQEVQTTIKYDMKQNETILNDSTTQTPTSTYTTETSNEFSQTTSSRRPDIPKIIVININETSTTEDHEVAWAPVSTISPHHSRLTTVNSETKPNIPITETPRPVDLVPKPLQGFGLEETVSGLDNDIYEFVQLCNELAFGFWKSVTNGISQARSVVMSPFAATSLLAMVFLGARGSTSGEMNEILKLDDMVTFNPHLIFKNVSESIEVGEKYGVAVSAIIRELYSDRSKENLLTFYKERARQFYDGHVEEVSFKEIGDIIRRRTNLLVKKQSNGKLSEFLKDDTITMNPPLAAFSTSIFHTDCSSASTAGRDGELHFVVLPTIRQRRLIPIPAVVYRSGFLAGYEPSLDATAVAMGSKGSSTSTIFIIPGQQGIATLGDSLVRLEKRLVESSFAKGAWSRLLRSLIPRPGLEVQIPRFSHRSIINATLALKRLGLKDLFDASTADLRGLNGIAHELHLSDMLQVNNFATCGEDRIGDTHHSEIYPATASQGSRTSRLLEMLQEEYFSQYYRRSDLEEPRDYQRSFHDPLHDPRLLLLPLNLRPRQARLPEAPRLRFDRPFLYVVRHNPTGLILHMGRFNPRLLP